MPERVADAIEEIARPNRGDQQERPQIQADPALRRPRLIRKTPAWLVAVIVLVCGVAAGWALFWALGLDAVSARPGLSIVGQLPVRIAAAALVAVIVAGLLAWSLRPAQTLRRTARTWGTAARRRTPRIPLFGSLTAAVGIGFGLAALASWLAGGAVFERATSASAVDVVRASLPTIAGVVIAVALVVVYRFGHGGAHRRCVRDGRGRR
jgi:hypothetical protein